MTIPYLLSFDPGTYEYTRGWSFSTKYPLSREGERARRRGETGFVSTSGKLYLVDM